MSWEAMRAMREHSRATGTARAVGVAVASYANVESGLAFPGNRDLQSWGWSERTIQEALRQLEDLRELERVPEMEDARRPRVYRLPLAGQIPLLDPHANGAGATVCAPADIAPAALAAPAALTRAREGTLRTPEPQPPLGPPASGGASDRLQSPARRRRSRRRRGRLTPSSVAASGPCPLNEQGAQSVELLASEWGRLKDPIIGRLGESVFEIWIAPGHLHRADDRLEIGYPVDLVTTAQARYARTIAALAGMPACFVPCASASELFRRTEAVR